MTSEQPTANRKRTSYQLERVLAVVAIVTLIAAWFIGSALRVADVEPLIQQLFNDSTSIENLSNDTYAVYQEAPTRQLVGYVAISTVSGYGGPMEVAIAVDLNGNITNMAVVEHKETSSFFNRVLRQNFAESLIGKSYSDNFLFGQDIDGVSGATFTTNAIAEAARNGSRMIAVEQLGVPAPMRENTKILFGVPEVTVILLYLVGYVGHQHKFKYTTQLRWVSMLTGLFVLGFWFNRPLTLAKINQFLMGFLPQWQTNLYWYLLLGGIVIVFTAENKNPYCSWFCPFGAAQECMGVIGGAKVRSVGQYRTFLKWLPRVLAWGAIVIAFLFRNPGLTSYEVFGTLFDLSGSSIQFVLLALILIVSMFVKRPWCTYLCPLGPVEDFIRMVRKWILELWKTRKNA